MTLMWDGDTQGVGEEHHMDTEGEEKKRKKKRHLLYTAVKGSLLPLPSSYNLINKCVWNGI